MIILAFCHTHVRKKYLCDVKNMHVWSTSLPSLHNTKYATFTAPLPDTLYLPQALPSLSRLHLPSLSTHSHSSLSCFVVLPAFSSFLCHPLQFHVVLGSTFPLFLYFLSFISTCPLQAYSHPYIHLFPPLSLFLAPPQYHPCDVKAIPATLCFQYSLI